MAHDLESVAGALRNGAPLCDDSLHLALGGGTLRLRSNSAQLIAGLRDYFDHVACAPAEPDLDVVAIEREAPEIGLEFIYWKRGPGKSGRKDSYVDLPGGRAIRKVRSGMVFLQSKAHRIAAGPCLEYDNQVINFINAQYMNWLQHRGWMICHASGLVRNGCGFAIACFSGGGKSNLMLKLLEHDGVAYLTSDRLFVHPEGSGIAAPGVPKLPRINPGTLVHNPRLHALIEPERREELLGLPPSELCELEEKYDVLVERVYGADSIVAEAPLTTFLVLNWKRHSESPMRVKQVDLAARRDLLGAIMKSPGPFYQLPDGSFQRDDAELDQEAYLDSLLGVAVFEASGRVDFEGLTDYCLEKLLG